VGKEPTTVFVWLLLFWNQSIILTNSVPRVRDSSEIDIFLIIDKGPVTIDGATHGCSSGPCVEITGSGGALGFKLTIKTGNSIVRGMIFNGCGFACVSLTDVIEGN